jgi:Spy/CpxP family protein refolding chaperone
VKSWKVILATLVIFGAGVVTGALAAKRVQVSPPDRPGSIHQRAEFMRRMEKRLDLTAVQREQIEAILSESQERTRKLWEQVGPKMKEEFQQTSKRISDELTAPQKIRFEELLQEQKAHRRPEDPRRSGERKKVEDRRAAPSFAPTSQDSPRGGSSTPPK